MFVHLNFDVMAPLCDKVQMNEGGVLVNFYSTMNFINLVAHWWTIAHLRQCLAQAIFLCYSFGQ